MPAKYAVYYEPDPGSELAPFGERWTGVSETGAPLQPLEVPGISASRFAELTVGPLWYGFHGTLKPQFVLNPAAKPDHLMAAARVFARGLVSITIPLMEIAVIGKFIALTPTTSSPELEKLEGQCVRAFEAYRSPLSDEQPFTVRTT